MNLSEREWRAFIFPEVFDIKGGFYNKKPVAEENGTIPFIGATDSNNGITQFNSEQRIDETSKTGDKNNAPLDKKIFKGNCIVVTNNGSVGYAYYQRHPFTCSHDVNPLYLKNRTLTPNIACFLICIIEKQRVCFSYVHKWRPKRMKKSKILLPITETGKPDFDFMEKYIESRVNVKREEYLDYCKEQLKIVGGGYDLIPLKDKEWKSFFIVDVFDTIQRGKRLKTADHLAGEIPYVSSSALNNGVDDYVSNNNGVRRFSNCLSLANSGSVGSSFYEPFEFVASDHITHLKNEEFNKYHYLFLATVTSRLSQKYNFNREINDKRISREIILLPLNDKGEPDYEYMEKYSKNLLCEKIQMYIKYIENK